MQFLTKNGNMIRLSIWKTQHFYVIHLYIYIYIYIYIYSMYIYMKSTP